MLDLRDLKPGVTLGRYEILMPVAQGGMAAVWAARMVGSRGFQKIVAIKTMLPGLSDDPEFEAMFLDEARLASRIRHPYVAEILDLGDDNGMLYLVMEWVNGETLFVLNRSAKEKGGFPLPILLRMLSSICAGLHAAHEMRDDEGRPLGLVHRDVNPANIMISYDGIVKVVDFGVAKATARVSITRVPGMLKGKAHYMAPEQVRGEPLDRRVDIFSLGILMYVMITGRHPFKAATDKQTMDNIVSAVPVPIFKLVPSARHDLVTVVMRALAKDPAKRWSDCAEMQRAIDQISNSIDAAVTDGDVAKFVRGVMGGQSEKRRADLAAAIQAADARGAAIVEPPASRRRDEPPSSMRRGGAPSSRGASLEGIIPVSLEDDTSGSSADLPPLSIRADVPPLPPSPAPLVHAPRRRSNTWIVLVLLVVLLGAGTFAALQAGVIPGMAPPRDETSASPPPSASPPSAPPPASVVPAIAAPPEPAADASVDAPADALDAAASDAASTSDDALDAGADVRDGGRIENDAGWYFENGFWHPPPGWKGRGGSTSKSPGSRPIDPSDPYGGGN